MMSLHDAIIAPYMHTYIHTLQLQDYTTKANN